MTLYAGDLNETYFVGNVDEESRRLVQCTYESLEKAIAIGIFKLYTYRPGFKKKMIDLITVKFGGVMSAGKKVHGIILILLWRG